MGSSIQVFYDAQGGGNRIISISQIIILNMAKNILNMDLETNSSSKIQPNTSNKLTKSFRCHYCLQSFTQSGRVRRHVKRIHEKSTEFVCKTCLKSFRAKGNLKRHFQNVHMKEKNFSCDTCSKSFAQ